MNSQSIIIDAAAAPLGRIASFAAKQALRGASVIIVNCSQAIITGNRRTTIEEYKTAASRGGAILKGPFLPKKNTERIMKRTIRGMLPYKQERGRTALKRILCYAKVPAEYEKSQKISLTRPIRNQTITLAEIAEELS